MADGERTAETGGHMFFEPVTQACGSPVHPDGRGSTSLSAGSWLERLGAQVVPTASSKCPQRPMGSPGPRRVGEGAVHFSNFEERMPEREGIPPSQFGEAYTSPSLAPSVPGEPTTLGTSAAGRVAAAKSRIEQPLGQGLGLASAWNERSAETADSPHSERSATSASQPGGGCVSEMSPLSRLMEGIVAEEIAGSGECLSICAGRSRTLKLLGFQHLHFDARLQGFSESRASSVLRPVTDASLSMRGFLGFRETARHSFSWRRLASHQQEKHRCAQDLVHMSQVQSQHAERRKSQVTRSSSDQMEDFQHCVMSEWSRAALDAKFQRYAARLYELSDAHELQRVEKEESREKHVRERLQKYSSLLGHMQGQCFSAWKAATEDSRDRERRQQRSKMSFFNATTALSENVVQSWSQQTRDNRSNRRRQEMLREQKSREVSRISRTGMQQGVEIYCIMQAWHHVMVHHRHGEHQRSRAMEASARMSSDQSGLAFTAWSAACKAQRATEAQRFQVAQKTSMMGLQANSQTVWAAWARGMEQRKQKQRSAQQIFASQQQSSQRSFKSWQHGSKQSKGQGHRSASIAQRAFAKTLRSCILEIFVEWKDFTRRERLRVLKAQVSRAQATSKTMGASKVKAATQQDSGCLSRTLLCWRLSAAEQSAISKERRKLAKVGGSGRASAVRLRGRLVQQRAMLAWSMITKVRPLIERPGTFIVKSLQPQACLASPSPVQVYTSVEAVDEPMTVQVEASPVPPGSPPAEPESAAAAAAAAAWLQAESPSPRRRFRVTTSPTRCRSNERYTLACKAATSDGDYRQLLEQHRREIREQREAARRSSPERVQWGVWAK